LRRVSTIGGDLSYALYATHWAMLMAFDVVLRRLFGETTSTVNFGYQLLVVGALAGIAFVLARYFDPIARRMLRSLLERRQPAPVG
jgi:peptidoglycan/LPS O-acetylase OafA/YrhL